MQFTLSSAVSINVKYLRLRDGVYQFYRRVPRDLVDRFGTSTIRLSLKTTDPFEATRRCEELARDYEAEFNTLRNERSATASTVKETGVSLANRYDYDTFVDLVVTPLREKYAAVHGEAAYWEAELEDYLKPQHLEALHILRDRESEPNALRLSGAFGTYLEQHPRGQEDAFKVKQQRDWNHLVNFTGDIKFSSLTRTTAREFIRHLLAKGLKTATVRRTLNTIVAVINATLREKELHRTNPFADLQIPGAGQDAKERRSASAPELKAIAEEMFKDMGSPVALLILLQMELGTRIGEVSGLSIHDVYLDHEVPHVHFRKRPWRSLKTSSSERRVPLVGLALEAAKAALSLPRKGGGQFESYAKDRGADHASSAVNSRLKKWNLTSHEFRHTMKDRLRDAGCPADIRDAIQGHAHGSIAETYGRGHTLRTMRDWLSRIALEIP